MSGITLEGDVYLAFTNASEGREDDFDRWHDQHMRELVDHVPGFVSGRRFVLDPLQRAGVGAGEPAPWRYLAVYALAADDVPKTLAALDRHEREVGLTDADGAVASDGAAWVYSALAPRVSGGRSLGAGEHAFLALTNPAPGRASDFDVWYANHLPEILDGMDGFVAGRRYAAVPAHQRAGEVPAWGHLALYDLEGDLTSIHARDAEVRASGELTASEGVFAPSFAIWVYTPVDNRVVVPHQEVDRA